MAVNYETYKFTELTATYNPLVGTGVSGRVAMYWEYDVFDPPPIDYLTATAQPGFVSTSPFFSVTTKLNTRKAYLQTPVKYVKSDAPLDRLNDTAKLIVIVLSPAGGTPALLGQISLKYSIALQTPSADGPVTYSIGEALFETKESKAPGVTFVGGASPAVGTGTAATYNTIGSALASTNSNGLIKLPQGQYKLRSDYELAHPYSNTANPGFVQVDHGFMYNIANSLSGGTFDKCATTSASHPAAVGAQTYNSHRTAFECFVDLAVETYVAPAFGYGSYTNIGATSVLEGATLAVERLGNSIAAALFGGGGFTATSKTEFAPPPSPDHPDWPPVNPPVILEHKLEELTLTEKARNRLILKGYKEPFPEDVLDALPPEEWIVVRATAS